jgi:DNA-binding winged helix-turn-helix (wHTH) protein
METSSWPRPWLPPIHALLRDGPLEQAEHLLTTTAARAPADPPTVAVAAAHAIVQFERGQRLEAIEALRTCVAGFDRADDPADAAWCRLWLARCLLITGQRRRALPLLRDAQTAGIEPIAWGERGDPVLALRHDEAPPPPTSAGAWTRAQAVAAVRAAVRGEALRVDALVAEVDRVAQAPGYAIDRALAHLAHAAILAMEGLALAADAELGLALRAAAGEQCDDDLVMELVRALGDIVVVTGADRRELAWSATVVLPSDAAILDARSHELRAAGEPRQLRRHPVLRSLLYALARHPGRPIGKPALVEAVWGSPYTPGRHDDTLKSTIFHLRNLLMGSGIAITCTRRGYQLDSSSRFVYVAPFELAEAHDRIAATVAPPGTRC